MSSHMRSVLATAVIAAAALTSACSTTVTGAAAAAGPTTIAPNALAASMVVPALPDGISIDGEVDPAAAARDFTLGSRIFGVNRKGKDASCTLGPLLAGSDAFSAGHCGFTGSPRSLASGTRVGTVTAAVDTEPPRDAILDFMVVDFDAPLPDVPIRVAGHPVTGVLTEEAVKSLPPGTSVCFLGAESGIECGPLVDANSARIKVDVSSLDGDSGALAFVMDSRSQTVSLVGLLTGRLLNERDADLGLGITYLDAALEAAQATALVDAEAAKAVAGNPYYSSRVSPR